MKTSFLHWEAAVCLLPLLFTAAAYAEDAPAASGKEYALAHKSSFEGSLDDRSPFWPIGWKPSAPGIAAPVTQQQVEPEVKAESFVVTTISMQSDGALAVINGRTHAVGDRLPVDSSGREYVTIKQILDGAVILDYHGKIIQVTNSRRGSGKK